MAHSSLIVTQVLTPKKRADLLHRPRLVDFIHEHIDRRLLLVSASAGYGKTSLLIDYAHETDLPVCWLSIVPEARDPRVFLDYLIASIGQRFPQFALRSDEFLRSVGAGAEPQQLVGTLVNEIIETIPDYFVLVIDDYHIIDESAAVNLVLGTLIQHLPENCHVILSSRTVPTLTPRGLALLTARQEIAGLGVRDLRFTPDEIQAWIEQSYGQRISDRAAAELAEKSEGWITGILLTTHTMWKGLFEGIIRIQGSDSTVYEYLANEVFYLQTPEVQDFLLSTSILEEMNPALCNALVGITNSRETLRRLEEDNLFVSHLEKDEERWYRYHTLFREFLLTKLREERPHLIGGLHARAADLVRQSGFPEQAIRHYHAAGDTARAAEMILEVAAASYDSGRLDILAGWIDELPSIVRDRQPRLLWYRAKIHAEKGELKQAAQAFDRALVHFQGLGDVLGQAQTLVEMSVVLRFQGECQKAIEACEQAMACVSDQQPHADVRRVIALAHRQKGICMARLGGLDAGERELRQALAAYEQLEDTQNMAHVHNDLGVTLRLAGNLSGSAIHFRRALDIWEARGNAGMAALTMNNIALGHHYRGEYEQALQLYEMGLGRARRAGLDRVVAFILAGMGDAYRDQGSYAQALQAYEEGLEAARLSREAFIIGYLLDAQGNTHRLMGNVSRALDLVRQAYERALERSATYEIGLYLISLGVIHHQQGNTNQAREYLRQACDIFTASSARRELARANCYLAQTLYVAGRFQEAMDCLRQVLQCLLELGYWQFLAPVIRETTPVVEYALTHGLANTLLSELVRTGVGARDPGPAVDSTPAVQPLLRIYGLGESRVLCGEHAVTASEWGMAKSKELLFYLLCSKECRKEQIGIDLWPDLSAARLRSSFHVALYRLRRALGRQDCVQYEGDRYFFNRQINYWYDVDEFLALIDRANGNWATARTVAVKAYREAALLYGGPFLPDLNSDNEWYLFMRESLQQKYLLALERLGDYCAAQTDYREALSHYEKLVREDSYHELARREIIRCLALLGERIQAAKAYQQWVSFLDSELGVPPAEETTALYERIIRGRSLET